ncbi:MAG TPA: PAS domain S-box protein [Cyclobacteriaceae bacterium]
MNFISGRNDKLKRILTENESLKKQHDIASSFINAIKSGNLGVTLSEEDASSDLANSLISLRDWMSALKSEEYERRWVNEGLANFGDILRLNQQKGLTELFDKLISHLVKYLKVNQGGVFILAGDDKNDPHLKLISCYAYEKKKFTEKRIEIGQGLAGQCFLEKEIIYMTQVPDNYIKITSGLGEALPHTVLLIPMMVDQHVLGILEFASFTHFEKYQIDFLQKIAESIAATYSSVVSAERTTQLLNESKAQAEQLKSQEEEMRQNMEELAASQEEITRRQIEGENRINAINQSGIASIEFDLRGIIQTANDAFLKMMGYTLDEIVGKHHRIFVSAQEAESDMYKQFWEDLQNGVARPGEFERITRTGNSVYIRGSYSIITDQNGKPTKVLKLATDITKLREQQLQTQRLLSEAQHQAEEMKAQEEELRQNMEELSTTQDEIMRRQIESENRIRAVDESGIAVIEFDLNGRIEFANEPFLKMMGYQLEEIKGKHHSIFVTEEYAKSEDYRQFWDDLRNGKSRPGEYERLDKNKSKVFIRGSYSIMRDAEGKPIKILKMASNITNLLEQINSLKRQLELSHS